MVLDGPNVDPKVPKAARRASEMVWGSRSKGLSQDFWGVQFARWSLKGSEMVLDGPNVDPKLRESRSESFWDGLGPEIEVP